MSNKKICHSELYLGNCIETKLSLDKPIENRRNIWYDDHVRQLLKEVLKVREEVAEKWVGIEEAADFLGIKPSTLREWLKKERDIPAHKIGKLWKFKCSELDAWVKSGKSAL